MAGDGGAERYWTVDEHLADILGTVGPLPPLDLQLLEAQGCLTVERITAGVDLPPFDNSSMDGYAVRVADVEGATDAYPSVLTVVGDVAAGAADLPVVGPGQCARIMTGAPLPPGAEAVVPVEWTDGGSGGKDAAVGMAPHSSAPEGAAGEVRVFRPAADGDFVRRKGDDITPGQVVLPEGTLLGPAQIGLLAAIGLDSVRVRPRPRVVVLSTGSELVQPGAAVGPGQISDSNSFALTAAARDAGAIAYRVGGVPDDAERLREVVEDQLIRADLVVTSGGVSVGAYDVVKEALAPEGVEPPPLGAISFRKLRMQPGKPQGFGLLDGRVPLFALPGNPVSAYLSFELFVRPAIRAMMGAGADEVHRPVVRAVLTEGLKSPAGRRQFARARYAAGNPGEKGSVAPVGGAGSHLVGPLAQANSVIVVPEDTTRAEAGDEVEVVLLEAADRPL
ncbi:molybdotransferase-like divisome protein Glp [Streptacidiphilus carbonis]|uniref:molybdotransferase-like divisome protein Glp n=1 Tax=Streptacidiphilus carbonis TaxID=105422 RepID=UPI000693B2DE|nr:gephyrin-like molybdotransferase Glp [Streptacidiphilus carbonis]